MKKIDDRVGIINRNSHGSIMKIIQYNNTNEVWVMFPQGNLVKCGWGQFCRGEVKNPYDKSVYGVGYFGEGNYKSRENGDKTPHYLKWRFMLQRCYDKRYIEKFPTYIGCSVNEEWHNYQNFAAWFDQNYYEIDGQRMELDKDILNKGNKIYSPDTAIIVPQRINYLFTKRDSKRGDLPIGVHWDKRFEKYRAQCNNGKVKHHIGNFDTIKEAFRAYKMYKEELIKRVATEYKEIIPMKLYEALITYEVDIND